MRAMILAAGLGTRMGPLASLCSKPALPVRGVPAVAILLRWLESQDIRHVMLNLHHRPDTIRDAVRRWAPKAVSVEYSYEEQPLGSGGGIARVHDFLSVSDDPCVVLAGDMLVDFELRDVIELHRERGDLATLVVRDDPRMSEFGSIGSDENECLRRVGSDTDLGGSTRAGLFTGIRILSPDALDRIAKRAQSAEPHFEDLRDVLVRAAAETGTVRTAQVAGESSWEPIGSPREYMAANFDARPVSYLDLDSWSLEHGTRFEPSVVIGAGSEIGNDCDLERVVVWPGESVPAGSRARNAVFTDGRFIDCHPASKECAS